MRIFIVFLCLGYFFSTSKVLAVEETSIWRLQLALATCNQTNISAGNHLEIQLNSNQKTQILNNPYNINTTGKYQIYELIPALLFENPENATLKDIKELSIKFQSRENSCVDHLSVLLNNPHDIWKQPQKAFQDLTDSYRILEQNLSNIRVHQPQLKAHTISLTDKKIQIQNTDTLWRKESAISVKALPIIIPENYWEGVIRSSFGHQLALLYLAEGRSSPSITWPNNRGTISTIYTKLGTRVKIQLNLLSTDTKQHPPSNHRVSFDLVVNCSGAQLDIRIENIQTELSPIFHFLTFGYAKLLERSLHHAAGASISRRNLAFATSCIAPNFLQTARLLSLL
ncbi:MAG: hypothetical protein KTR21_10670 [Rhodobacteraceae bacterium]|nr:hypothetical protein [Paracoccaceae bacterium]